MKYIIETSRGGLDSIGITQIQVEWAMGSVVQILLGAWLCRRYLYFFFFVGQSHKDAPTKEHPGNLAILMSKLKKYIIVDQNMGGGGLAIGEINIGD